MSNKEITLYKYLKELIYKKLLFFGIFFATFSTFAKVMQTVYMGKTMDYAFLHNKTSFYNSLFILIIIMISITIMRYIREKCMGYFAEKNMHKLRFTAVKNIIKADYASVSAGSSGDYLTKFSSDLEQVETLIHKTLINIFLNPIRAVIALTYMIVSNWKLTLISLITIPIFFYLSTKFTKIIGKRSKSLQKQLSFINQEAQEIVLGVETIHSYNLQYQFSKSITEKINKAVDYEKSIVLNRRILNSLGNMIGIMPYAISLIFGGYFVIKGELSIGQLTAFSFLIDDIRWPISGIPALLASIKRGMVSVKRVYNILDIKPEVQIPKSHVIKADPIIYFENVSFTYLSSHEQTLHKISFSIREGEKLALVGRSGSGKSTIIKLILGLYPNYKGNIFVYGKELREWNRQQLREQLSLVSQEAYLFPQSIANNIADGKVNASQQEIQLAAKQAQASKFINELPNDYQSYIKEAASNFSGGQNQRIAMARTIIKDAPIWLLDEPTSALDLNTSHKLWKTIAKNTQNKTCLIVTHKQESLAFADRVIAVCDGKLVNYDFYRKMQQGGK